MLKISKFENAGAYIFNQVFNFTTMKFLIN